MNHIGESTIFDDDIVRNVLHVPDFKFNLLLVSNIIRELSCFVSFYPNFCVYQDLFSGGLYMFKSGSTLNKIDKCKQQLMDAGIARQDTQLCYQRLGHPSYFIMKHLNLLSSNKNDIVSCHVCPLAKQIRQVFPSSNSRASTSFDLVHMNLWGPYKTPTLDKKHYFLTIVDDYNRFVWVYLLQLKSEILAAIKLFFSMIKT